MMGAHPAQIEIIFLGTLASFMLYSLLSKAVDRTILTLPIIFTGLGLALSVPLEHVETPESMINGKRLLAEVTLILVLFSDASHVRLSRLRQSFGLPTRMLVLGLPMTIALGTGVALLINPESGFAMALLTAAVLTPTDAALGQTVLSSPDVPPQISQTINVESGLNDGLVLPFVLLGAILASSTMPGAATDGLALDALLQMVLGPLIGIAFGWAIARLMDMAQNRDLIADPACGIVFLSTAFAAFITSELLGGNGFISAFVAGMVFGNTYKHDIMFIGEFMEGVGQLLTMLAFLVFGALMLPDGLAHMTWKSLTLAIAFLTIVRMLPIWLSLLGTGLKPHEKLFLGWFGPRGLASILFTLIMMDEFDFPGEEELLACVTMTVFLSIILHGFSATPLSKWIGRKSVPTPPA